MTLNSHPFTTHLILPLIFLLTWTEVAVSGWSSINQRCTPYQDQYNSCDPYAYLFCDTSGHEYVCKCSSREFVWQSLVGRCTLRIGSSCYRGPMGTTGASKVPDCPPSAYCDIGTYTCKCHANHIPSPDGSTCNKGVALQSRTLVHLSILATTAVIIGSSTSTFL